MPDCPRCGERTTHPNDAFDVLGMAKRIQQLEAALRKYADHLPGCNTYKASRCSCGFEATLTTTSIMALRGTPNG